MTPSFKQFSEAYDKYHAGEDMSDIDPALVEGFFASDESRVKRLHDLAKNGDERAASQLDILLSQLQKKKKVTGQIQTLARSFDSIKSKMQAAKKNQAVRRDAVWSGARDRAEADERGSSRAYDKEAGSISKNNKPYWDNEAKRWVKPNTLNHIGN